MRRSIKILYLFVLSIVLTKATPKFGERLKKDDKNSSLIEVFRPNPTQSQPTIDLSKRLSASEPNPNHNYNNNNNFGNEFQFSTSHPKHNKNNELLSTQTDSKHRTIESDKTKPQTHPQPHPIQHHFPPEFSSFNFNFDIPEVSSSDHMDGPPLAPPPPQAPHQAVPDFQRFQNQEHNYDSTGNAQTFYESAANRELDPEFSFNVPQGFPHPQQDPRADFKKELMGKENSAGTPWGTKMSYTYKDPKNPNNYMSMSEVRMSVNREMDPQEAQSQVQKFLANAQSGQYGPFKPIHIQESSSDHFDRHPNHNYGSEISHFAPNEPSEPSEPKFPNF